MPRKLPGEGDFLYKYFKMAVHFHSMSYKTSHDYLKENLHHAGKCLCQEHYVNAMIMLRFPDSALFESYGSKECSVLPRAS